LCEEGSGSAPDEILTEYAIAIPNQEPGYFLVVVKPSLCQRMTVSGLRISNASFQEW
jgi:hypothetical protein